MKIRKRDRDRTNEWKAFRYNTKVNPEVKQYAPELKLEMFIIGFEPSEKYNLEWIQ